MQNTSTENDYLIDVKKKVDGKEKTSVVDVRDVNWEKISDVWKNDAGWQPCSNKDVRKLEHWIKKSSEPVKNTPLAPNPSVEESWRQVVQEQKKSEEKFKKELKVQPITLQKKEPKKKGNPKILLIYTVVSSISALSLGLVYLKLVPDIKKTKEYIENSKEPSDKIFENSPDLQNTKKEPEQVIDSNKAYFMKYIIEETIWRAKVKAALYTRAHGRVDLKEIKDYTNINSTATEVITAVNKMFEKFGKRSNLTLKDLSYELKQFEEALSLEELQAKKIICDLANATKVSFGTYPDKKVAQRANKEKWISPLGSLHEATTGKSHKGKYITEPNDPRSVGIPVTWEKAKNENTQ